MARTLPSTALAFAVLGIVMLLRQRRFFPRPLPDILLAAVAIVAGGKLFEYFSGISLGVDERLVADPAMFGAVQRSITSPIVIEVYDALAMDVFDPAKKPNPAALKVTIPEMVRVLRHRVGMYTAPPGPPEPAADNEAPG